MPNWMPPPSAEQVAKHAKENPAYLDYGMWNVCVGDQPGQRILLGALGRTVLDFVGNCVFPHANARYLPLTAEGIPVDYAELEAENAHLRSVIAIHDKHSAIAELKDQVYKLRERDFENNEKIVDLTRENAALKGKADFCVCGHALADHAENEVCMACVCEDYRKADDPPPDPRDPRDTEIERLQFEEKAWKMANDSLFRQVRDAIAARDAAQAQAAEERKIHINMEATYIAAQDELLRRAENAEADLMNAVAQVAEEQGFYCDLHRQLDTTRAALEHREREYRILSDDNEKLEAELEKAKAAMRLTLDRIINNVALTLQDEAWCLGPIRAALDAAREDPKPVLLDGPQDEDDSEDAGSEIVEYARNVPDPA